jgi:hypothetical protein
MYKVTPFNSRIMSSMAGRYLEGKAGSNPALTFNFRIYAENNHHILRTLKASLKSTLTLFILNSQVA